MKVEGSIIYLTNSDIFSHPLDPLIDDGLSQTPLHLVPPPPILVPHASAAPCKLCSLFKV